STISIDQLFRIYDIVPRDTAFFESNLDAVSQHLSETHGFHLSDDDLLQIRYVLSNFFQEGPDLSYSFLGSYYQGTLGMPTYRQLMIATDGNGHNWSFLATEDNFLRIQALQRKKLIIPLVVDFARPKTMRSIGHYMTQHHA